MFVGQRKDPFVVNLGETFDLINIKAPATEFDANAEKAPRTTWPQERDHDRAGSAHRLPDRGRQHRSRHRRLDHGQRAPGPPAQPDAKSGHGRRRKAAPGRRCRASACRW
jgi:hypothetical protein